MKSFLGLVVLLGIFHLNEGCASGRKKQNKNPRFNAVQQTTLTRPPPVHPFQKTFGINAQKSTATCKGDANGKCRAACKPGEYLKGRFDCKGSEHCCAPNPRVVVATTKGPDVVVEEATKGSEITAEKTTEFAEVIAEKTTESAEVKAEKTTKAPKVTAEETTTGPEAIAEETTKALEGVAEEKTTGPEVITLETTETATDLTLEVTAEKSTTESPEITTKKVTTPETTIEHITEATTGILETNAEPERTLASLPLTRPTSVHGRNQKSFGIKNVQSTATCTGDAKGTCRKECDQKTEYVKGLFDCGIETPKCCGLR